MASLSFVPVPEVVGVPTLPRHLAPAPATAKSSEMGLSRGTLPIATAGAMLAMKQKRQRVRRFLGPSASAELLEVRTAEAQGTATDVKPWQFLSGIAKDAARAWFVQRAEERGIAWRFSVEKMQAQQEELEAKYHELRDESVEYPWYYVKPFHGYDEGNLSWRAAHELEAATQSMCLGYYDGMTWQDAQEQFRGAARESLQDFWQGGHDHAEPGSVLDVGCSGGYSSQEMSKAFPSAQVTGLDLSPYFLSVAQQNFPGLQFVHANAEDTGLPSHAYDMVTLNFLLHELPLEATRNVLREALRLLKPGGVLAVLDVDPQRLANLPPFRRWAFQVTEPWCKEGEYFALDLPAELQGLGFEDTTQSSNDPVNTLTLARKSTEPPK